MEWTAPGLVVAVRRYGEGKAIVNLLTEDRGRHPGLVHGGGALQPGTMVAARWRGRDAENLGTFRCEMVAPLSPVVLADRGRLEALAAACVVVETALPEREPYPGVYADLCTLLSILAGSGPWGGAFVRWEIGLLRDLGYGLDLGCCAVTGACTDLRYVSPRTGRAVSAAAAGPYRARLLPLPGFLTDADPHADAGASPAAIGAGLRLTGHFLERNVYGLRNRSLPAARLRLARHFEAPAVDA
jgi:DNA repair protein RecO (recombination protein O)